MTKRSIFAIASLGLIAMTLPTDAAEDESAALPCPGLIAHITFLDYDGQHPVQMCVAAGGFSFNGSNVTLRLYDNGADGIYHNGFEQVP